MSVRFGGIAFVASFFSLAASAATPPATTDIPESFTARSKTLAWPGNVDRATTRGGSVQFFWNDDLLGDLGLQRSATGKAIDAGSKPGVEFALSADSRFEVDVIARGIDAIAGGVAALQGHLEFSAAGRIFRIENPVLLVRPGAKLRIDLVGRDGATWLYGDRLMYEMIDDGKKFHIRSMDLRISPQLAKQIANVDAAGQAIAEVQLTASVGSLLTTQSPKACGDPNWPGRAAPVAGDTYKADVFMNVFTGSYSRCRATAAGGACDGPTVTATDGDVVFTPSSTLRNNVNNGTAQPTVAGDPLGTSSALYTADVAWFQKFTGVFAPYGNDQHPYLIWNLYRLDPDGSITQIGRSGVKHAFLTTNTGCAPGENCNSHILGRQCGDTYGTGNNDSSSDLGPRSEIIPAKGIWGRCGSIYDTNCDGVANASGNTTYSQRMITKESALAPTLVGGTGATLIFESWYIVREDINIYNTMASRPVSVSWSGTAWSITNGSPMRLGPAIDRWVESAPAGTLAVSGDLASAEGNAKVAVRVRNVSPGSNQFTYAVMNFDFAREVTQGAEPNLRVLSNNGFRSFSVPIASGAAVTATAFDDGDPDPSNDWTANVTANAVTFTAPNNAASLNWGTMFRFVITTDGEAVSGQTTLEVTQAGTPASFAVTSRVVGPAANPDVLFRDGFE